MDIYILAQLVIYHIVIHIEIGKKWKFNITTSKIIHSKVHLINRTRLFEPLYLKKCLSQIKHVYPCFIAVIKYWFEFGCVWI